ncbi:Sodium/calcium exchanger protein-domain-containing protein [Russula earlei]|uniref:Sodium/calcium exchanger protein-domain-containing protein n=1 Tax=Russula earlei TaxID=71964 RepID=A0ACC0UKM5_9AGAM|nr:Sodium/calcium exchanger protein-domain-containing protein [Russula earlei]
MGSYVTIKSTFVALLVLNVLLWSQGPFRSHGPFLPVSDISKRTYAQRCNGSNLPQCQPIAFPVEEQCELVHRSCPASDTFLSIPYLHIYFCATPTARPLVFVGLLLWLGFLFSTLGISAADFFCPNLATIAQHLNLDEHVAGVTFLAFGNGSPDVFATFSALRTNAGSLAIGELLGAASFIISCVVGSLCIIKPFRVNRGPFLRDAAFFTVAVMTLLIILLDGKIYAWEAALLVLLYVAYVLTVVVGSWWEHRRERRELLEARMRSEYDEEGVQPYRDDPIRSPSSSPLLFPDTDRQQRPSSLPHIETQPLHQHGLGSQLDSRSPSRSPHTMTLPFFSLVGALEFRSVISSLQQDAAGTSLGAFDPPWTPYPGGHYHGFGIGRSRSRASIHSRGAYTDASSDVPLSDRSPLPPVSSLPADDLGHFLLGDPLISLDIDALPQIPEISHTPASPQSDTHADVPHHTGAAGRHGARFVLSRASHVLFPTLYEFHMKSLLGKVVAVFAAPSVFALTVTLPVVVRPYDSSSYREKARSIIITPSSFEEDGVARTLVSEEVLEETHELKFSKWLMAVQCVLGPLFCTAVLFKNSSHVGWLLLGIGLAGLAAGISVMSFANKGDHQGWDLARCLMGFLVAVVWIMAIADEVVNVLQTFGFIFGLSDAIIGVTIFAAGNSVADLVANMSVAEFAPVMGFSACFGGPMLNILLGVGISGSYVIHTNGHPYELEFSKTLLVSSVGLFALLVITMIFVPLNDYFLPRKWGVFLICFYVVIMTVNVAVEVLGLD